MAQSHFLFPLLADLYYSSDAVYPQKQSSATNWIQDMYVTTVKPTLVQMIKFAGSWGHVGALGSCVDCQVRCSSPGQ